MREYIILVTVFLILATPLMWFVGSGGVINLERPYHYEYNQCENELSQCIESKIPSCAPCECKVGSDAIIFTIFGIVFGIAGYVLYFVMLRKANKLEEKSKKK